MDRVSCHPTRSSRETRGANRCCVPCCTNNSTSNPELSFHRPRDIGTKRKWEAAIASRHPSRPKELHAARVCSSHFADDAYLDEDILRVRLGVAQKKKRLKLDAVPTIFQGQRETEYLQQQPGTCMESSMSEMETVEAKDDAGPLPDPERIMRESYHKAVVLDGLTLQPLVPYQNIGQCGFVYTLVPVGSQQTTKNDARQKWTPTATPTSTLGTQTCFPVSSTSTQTELSLL